MSDDDFQTKPSSKAKLAAAIQRPKEGQELLLVDSKWKGSPFIEKIKEQVCSVYSGDLERGRKRGW